MYFWYYHYRRRRKSRKESQKRGFTSKKKVFELYETWHDFSTKAFILLLELVILQGQSLFFLFIDSSNFKSNIKKDKSINKKPLGCQHRPVQWATVFNFSELTSMWISHRSCASLECFMFYCRMLSRSLWKKH